MRKTSKTIWRRVTNFIQFPNPPDKHLFPGHLEIYLEHGQVKTYEYLWCLPVLKGRFLSKILPVTMETD